MVLCEWHCSGIEPAVDNLWYTVHFFATVRAFKGNCINIRTMKFYLCILRISASLCKFCTASDALLMSTFTLPYRKWCSPVTVTGDTPVLDILKPVTETSFSDGIRDPVYSIVVADQVIFDCSHFDKPGFSCVIDEWCVTSPAVRIFMLELRSIE